MDYFVIKTSGSQYIVSPGDVLELPNLNVKEGETVNFDEVLLQKVGDKLEIGKPLVSGASLKGQVLKNYQGEKLDIFKFKAKSRYRRKTGFRAQLTSVVIAGGPTVVAEKKTVAKKAAAPVKESAVKKS